jgi:hypothetical protein
VTNHHQFVANQTIGLAISEKMAKKWSREVVVNGSLKPLEAELKQLCKGQGVWSDDLRRRIGTRLRARCGIDADDNDATARFKLTRIIGAAAAALPETLRGAAFVALAVHPDTRDLRFLVHRTAWLAERHGYTERTARRRVDGAMRQLAAELGRDAAPAGPLDQDVGWYVESLAVRMTVDRTSPHAVEDRRIVSTIDGLYEIIHRVNLPFCNAAAGDRRLEFEVLHGGTARLVKSTGSHFSYAVSLPAGLNVGDRHEYRILSRVSDGRSMAAQYLCVPLRRHDFFDLRIQFDVKDPPAKIWQVDAAPPRVVDDRVATEPALVPDRVGVVHLEFRNLRVGFGYGVQWTQ